MNKIGSNQFQTKRRFIRPQTLKSVLIVILILSFLIIVDLLLQRYVTQLQKGMHIVSPLAVRAAYADGAGTPILTQQDLIRQEIQQVFGQYADKAFKVLSCENGSLNPNAFNVNNDPEHSRDFGIFQINNHWQGVTNEAFLKDYHINIRMAWSIFSRDHYSFKLWTCGRKLGL